MANYVSVPRDLSRVKSKIIFNLTKRQVLCFGAAILIGVPAFFLFRKSGNTSLASLGMIIIMLPFFFMAMYEKDGQPFEVVVKHFVDARFRRKKVRPYRTNNYYTALQEQDRLWKEVDSIVCKAQTEAESIRRREQKPAGRKRSAAVPKGQKSTAGGRKKSRGYQGKREIS